MSSITAAASVAALPNPMERPAFEGDSLLMRLLADQHCLTAVEQFADASQRDAPPAQARYYRDLIPAHLPGRDEQFAFEVDLDACSGCKACVTACHNLNGLEPSETWRGVGLLYGGADRSSVVQHVTTACHHCLEPGCLDGCPVLAYEKDPITGIVRHLDDQCIGCQYCILKCPYDVPKYSPTKGIVRKCDMCSSRLAVGEAPACVQACPHAAIRITTVNRVQTAEACDANLFLPHAPDASYTRPSTVYRSKRPLPDNLLPSDYYAARPQHAHWPLILMLVFTQASVGTFLAKHVWARTAATPVFDDGVHRLAAFGLGLIGLTASIFHLGRPQFAYRAWIGLRTSWLSREILAFGAFAGLASCYAAVPWLAAWGLKIGTTFDALLGDAVALSGLVGIVCSALIYSGTRRPYWHGWYTIPRFLLTGVLLGTPAALLISLVATASDGGDVSQTFRQIGPAACRTTLWAAVAKLALEASIFVQLGRARLTSLRRTAALLVGDLGLVTLKRYVVGGVGGVLLPWWLWSQASMPVLTPSFLLIAGLLALVVSFVGELLERYLFFTAVVAPKMPGVPAS